MHLQGKADVSEGIRIQGAKQLMKKLNAVARHDSRAIGLIRTKAVRIGAKPIWMAARAKCPKRHGQLKRSMGAVYRTYRRSSTRVAVIGARSGFKTTINGRLVDPRKYLHLMEYGTAPHQQHGKFWIPFLGFVSGIRHPGAKAQPFIRPAYDSQAETAASLVMKEMWAGVERALAKK